MVECAAYADRLPQPRPQLMLKNMLRRAVSCARTSRRCGRDREEVRRQADNAATWDKLVRAETPHWNYRPRCIRNYKTPRLIFGNYQSSARAFALRQGGVYKAEPPVPAPVLALKGTAQPL